jgi:type I restriction enzyme S subunit
MKRNPAAPLSELLVENQDMENVDPDKIYVTVGLLNHGRGLFKRPAQRGDQTKYRRYNKIHAHQVIYSRLFGWEGSISLVEPEFDELYASPEFPTFDINTERATPEYLRYLLCWPGLHEMMAKCTTGLGQRRQRVQVGQLLSLRVPVPADIEEQRRIAARLDYLYKRRREASEHAKRATALVRALHDALCQVGGQAERVGDKITLVRNPVSVDAEKTYRQIGIYSFGKGMIRRDPMPGTALSTMRYFQVPIGALVLSNIQAWEAAIAVSSEEDEGFIASHRFLSYIPVSDDIDTSYLRYFFLSNTGLPLIQRASPGTMVRNRTLGIKAFEDLQIPLPDIMEQRRIRSLLDQAYGTLRRIEEREKLFEVLIAAVLNHVFSEPG